MTEKEFNRKAVEIPEVGEIYSEWKTQKKAIDKTRRKLKRAEKRYEFLKTIIGIGKSGEELELAFVEFFKDLGYKDVRHIGGDNKHEDIDIWDDDILTVIEVKGTGQQMPTQPNTSQVLKYILDRRIKHPKFKVFGITIVNHDNKKQLSERNKNPFDKERIKHAKNGGYGLVSAIDLFTEFYKIKKGLITLEDFDERLHQTGLLKIGSKNKR